MKARSPEDKKKDIKIAALEHQIETENQNKKRNRMIFLILLIHIIILSICVPLSAVYGIYMEHQMQRPQNCLFYTYDLKYDFKAKCQVCMAGFDNQENEFQCIKATKIEQ